MRGARATAAAAEASGPPRLSYRAATILFLLFAAAYLARPIFRGEILLPFDFVFWTDPVFRPATPPGLEPPPSNLIMALDRVYQFHPWTRFTAQALRRAEFPLWNPWSVAGTPHLALVQSAVLDPLAVLCGVAAGVERASTWRALLSVLVAGTGMLLLARRLRLPAVGGLLAAVAFTFGGWFVLWLDRPMSAAAAWMPWILWSLDRLMEGRRRWRETLLASSFVALSFLAGHVETTAHVCMLGAAFVVFRAWPQRGWADRLRHSVRGLTALVAGAALAAALLVPFAAFLLGEAGGPAAVRGEPAQGSRLGSGLRGEATAAGIRATLSTAVIPVQNVRGSPPFAPPLPNLAEHTLYVGVVPLLLALAGLLREGRTPDQRFWLAVAGLALILALQLPLLHLLNQLPIVRWIDEGRLRLLYGFAVSLLAAAGVAWGIPTTRPRWLAVVALVLLGLGVLHAADVLRGAEAGAWVRGLAGVVPAIALLLAATRSRARHAGVVALLLTGAELWIALHGAQPSFPPAQVFPTPPAIRFLQEQRDGRVATFALGRSGDKPLLGAMGLVYGLDCVEGYNVLYSARQRALIDCANRDARGPEFHPDLLQLRDPGNRLVDLMGVRFLITAGGPALADAPGSGLMRQFPQVVFTDGSAAVWENPDPLPPAFLVRALDRAEDARAATRWLERADHDFRRRAVVEAPASAALPAPWPDAVTEGAGTVEWDRPRLTEIAVRVDAPHPALLVITSTYAAGWRAELDGRPTPVYPTDVAFLGVTVPAGRHVVRLRYAPRSFPIGLAVSLASLALLCGLALAERLRARVLQPLD